MPELPEVETTIKGLRPKVLKRTFVDVWTDSPKIIKKPAGFKDFKKKLKRKKINRIWRRGKNIIFDLSCGLSLLVHQKMTGHLLVGSWKLQDKKWVPLYKGPLGDPANRFVHLMFWLTGDTMVALSDMRKFAKVELWGTRDLLNSESFKKLGPELLENNFTFERFKEVLQGKRGKIKQVLMNQEIIAGIGNIYSDEALFTARIHPLKDVSSFNGRELTALYKAIREVLKKGIKLGGESFADYRNTKGEKGNYDDERRVYRREGEGCFNCKGVVKRIKVSGRSAHFCPSCQKL